MNEREAQIRYDNRQEPEDRNWREVGVRKECAWCGIVLCEGEEPTSHGICRECAEKELEELG